MSPHTWFAPLAALPSTAVAADFGRHAAPEDAPRAAAHGRRSAVLLLFGRGLPAAPATSEAEHEFVPDDAWVLLTRRAATLRSHAGQVALPGGRIDPDDASPTAAALRETAEECGIDVGADSIAVAGTLPLLYLPPSNWLVTPVLAHAVRPLTPRVVDPAEVERVDLVRVGDLLHPRNRFTVAHPSGFRGPGFGVGDLFIWGFTALLLDRVLALTRWERPWDASRIVGVPANEPEVTP